MLDRFERLRVHLLDVLAVAADRGHPERDCTRWDRFSTGMCCVAGVDSAQQLFSHEHRGHSPGPARGRRLWNRADVHGAVAEERERDVRLARSWKASAEPTIPGSPPPITALAPSSPRSTS